MSDLPLLLTSGPREAKCVIAYDIVRQFFGGDSATCAQQEWENTFSKGYVPEEMIDVRAWKDDVLVDVLLASGVISSKTEWTRLVNENAVKELSSDGSEIRRITEKNSRVIDSCILKVGKRRFVRISLL